MPDSPLTPLATDPILQLRGLHVRFATPDGEVHAVRGVDLAVHKGECVGVVGESGSGKSQTFLAAMGLLAGNGKVEGQALYRGQDLLTMSRARLNRVRGSRMTMIFQDPLTSLTPHMKIGAQMRETLATHADLRGRAAEQACLDWLQRVRIPEAKRRLDQYPHELSGGMRQRVMIAMSMLCDPDLLIADEPTTALDVTVQAEVLDIMDSLKRETGTAIALITHDMGVIARMADRVQVMKDGAYVEEGAVDDVFHAPKTPYTRMLLDAIPRLDKPDDALTERLAPPRGDELLVRAQGVRVWFPVPMEGGLWPKTVPLRAVDGVDFDLRPGETLGIVGESGSGKSTLARAVLQLVPVQSGVISWMGRDLTGLKKEELRKTRRDLQIVFQDPLASLDPRMSIGDSIAEPLLTFRPDLDRKGRDAEVAAMMERVGLAPSLINRYPHELSGGQNQRVGVARAMILRPKLVICDEAVSALDVSIQKQIIDLLIGLQRDFGMSMMFISHDLSVVRQISHRVMVLYLGRVMETASRDAIYENARHPYTRALISAAPIPDPRVEKTRVRLKLSGDLPSPLDPKAQLRFLPSRLSSAPLAEDAGAEQYAPRLVEVAPGHLVAEHDPVAGSEGLYAR